MIMKKMERKESVNHKNMLKAIIGWAIKNRKKDFKENEDFLIKPIEAYGYGYKPDAISEDVKIWLEVETDPFNVFTKMSYLLFFYFMNPLKWPKEIVFGVPEFKKSEIRTTFVDTFELLRPLLKIKITLLEMSEKITYL